MGRRRTVAVVAVIAVLLTSGYFLLTSSFFAKWVLLSRLSAALGGPVTASHVQVSPGGRVTIENAALKARGIRGVGAEVFRVDRVVAEVDLWSVLKGSPNVRSVALEGPVFRISQSMDDGTVNVGGLRANTGGSKPAAPSPSGSAAAKAHVVVPKITVTRGIIELGEHITDNKAHPGAKADNDFYTPLKQIAVAGEVVQADDGMGGSVVSFKQMDTETVLGPAAVPGGLAVTGRITDDGITLDLSGVALGEWGPENAPTYIRALFKQADVKGEVRSSSITYRYAGGWQAEVALNDVALNLPVTMQPDEDEDGNLLPLAAGESEQYARLTGVNGTIRVGSTGVDAALAGKLEELPVQVTIHADSPAADAAFTCSIASSNFRLESNPKILRFAPGLVRLRLAQFANPTGVVDFSVAIKRPAQSKEVGVNGTLTFRDVTAAFHKWPYRFEKMTGSVDFSESKIELKQITGVATSGAKVVASGTIAPPTGAAKVDLDIRVTDLPIDETLKKSLKKRDIALDFICNVPAYESLLAKGLIATPAMKASNPALANVPAFEMGGKVSVSAIVTRDAGDAGEWWDTITIDLPKVGIVPASVPYPMIAHNVRIIKKDTVATVEGGYYTPVGLNVADSARATIAAKVDIAKLETPNVPFCPDVEVDASDVPLNALLFNAIPDQDAAARLREMNIAGAADIEARVALNAKQETGFTVAVKIDNATASPTPKPSTTTTLGAGAARIIADDVSGVVEVTEHSLNADLEAELRSLLPEHTDARPTRANLRLSMGRNGDPAPFNADITLSKLNTAMAMDDLARPFAPAAAAEITEFLQARQPKGIADATVTVRGDATTVQVSEMKGVSLLEMGSRMTVVESRGSVELKEPAGTLTFTNFATELLAEGNPAGALTIDGTIPTPTIAGTAHAPADALNAGPVRVTLDNGRFESGFARALVNTYAPKGLASFVQSVDLAGGFSMDVTVTPPKAEHLDDSTVRGTVTPRSASLTLDGTRVTLDEITGTIAFGPDASGQSAGFIRNVTAKAPKWSATIDGSWLLTRAANDPQAPTLIAYNGTLGLTGESLTPDLSACLPGPLRSALADLSFACAGPITLEPTTLSLTLRENGDTEAFNTKGRITLTNASLDVGAKLTGMTGAIDFTADKPTDASARAMGPTFELLGMFPSLKAQDIAMTEGRARINGASDGSVLVPHLSANCHGGRFAGSATIAPPVSAKRAYLTDLRFADVRLASVLSDLSLASTAGTTNEPDPSRGLLSASVSLGGTLGDEATRRGRGQMTVTGGRVYSMPLLVPLVRVANLQFPSDEPLDFALCDAFISGNHLSIEEVSMASSSVQLLGFGTAKWPDLTLDLRFKAINRNRIPIITAVMENVRNELLSIKVNGTLKDPKVEMAPLSGTTRFLGELVGRKPDDQQRTLDAIEKRLNNDMRYRKSVVDPNLKQSGAATPPPPVVNPPAANPPATADASQPAPTTPPKPKAPAPKLGAEGAKPR